MVIYTWDVIRLMCQVDRGKTYIHEEPEIPNIAFLRANQLFQDPSPLGRPLHSGYVRYQGLLLESTILGDPVSSKGSSAAAIRSGSGKRAWVGSF